MNELIIEAKLENMGTVLDFVNGWLGDCPPKIQNEIGITVDEIFSNIARYAYQPSIGFSTVRVTIDAVITIEFEDYGIPYDPLSRADPDVSIPTGERESGGLGIFIVKNIMDSVEYRREGNKNILTIKKDWHNVNL